MWPLKQTSARLYMKMGVKMFFMATQQPATVIVQQTAPQTVYVEQPVRRRNFWNNGWWYPVVTTHIDLGHHGRFYGGHHGRHH